MSTYTARKAAVKGMACIHACRDERPLTPARARRPSKPTATAATATNAYSSARAVPLGPL
jgi:hypothetical protein